MHVLMSTLGAHYSIVYIQLLQLNCMLLGPFKNITMQFNGCAKGHHFSITSNDLYRATCYKTPSVSETRVVVEVVDFGSVFYDIKESIYIT